MHEDKSHEDKEREAVFGRQPEDAVEVLEWIQKNVARSDDVVEEKPTPPERMTPPYESAGCTDGGKAPDDPVWTTSWDVLKKYYAGGHGPLADFVRCKFTIATPDGCRITWYRGNFDAADLGIGGKWIRRKITAQKVREPNVECPQGYMECVHFDIDIQYEVSLRVGWLRLLSINNITRQKWLRFCADGSVLSG
ncbi:hypothetical protein SAMN02745206_00299 [Desulfacinum infernum DSM 9756]|uniref:Uncharacterized protein n=1 Tax=Desulfacinum infernum DSM 9756 TaxID=1121391 RepID=A0A1M4TJH0_9BACT|nr:hypothetical protein [Desulfacinum infernum]SHE44642.1 hypothetical protein SAMN02745206_00299 [Desulfacinum infernum DSM 9756]